MPRDVLRTLCSGDLHNDDIDIRTPGVRLCKTIAVTVPALHPIMEIPPITGEITLSSIDLKASYRRMLRRFRGFFGI